MTRRKKFRRGRKIKTVVRFAKAISEGQWIYFRHKPTHPGWAMSWSFRLVQQSIKAGHLWLAVRINP